MATYTIKNLRPVGITETQQAQHPNRVLTLHGAFFDEKGFRMSFKSRVQAVPLSIAPDGSHVLEPNTDDITAEGYVLDVVKGTLTVAGGTKGRPTLAALTADAATALLVAARKVVPEATAEATAE